MKKLLIIFLLILSLISFTACGSSYAKVTGIIAAVINFDSDTDYYGSEYADDSTLAENDYIIKVGEQYQIVLQYSYTGGSRTPVFASEDNVKLVYDYDLLQIGTPIIKHGLLYYPLVCRKEVFYTAILIEVDEKYHTEVIVSSIQS